MRPSATVIENGVQKDIHQFKGFESISKSCTYVSALPLHTAEWRIANSDRQHRYMHVPIHYSNCSSYNDVTAWAPAAEATRLRVLLRGFAGPVLLLVVVVLLLVVVVVAGAGDSCDIDASASAEVHMATTSAVSSSTRICRRQRSERCCTCSSASSSLSSSFSTFSSCRTPTWIQSSQQQQAVIDL
jgi:hypothetical protein